MIDGVYSMYGDFAPVKELENFLNTFDKLHIYADDAHGMGWTGEKGRGYVLSQMALHPKMILATSLNKAFGAGGGVFVIPDKALCDKVKHCGAGFTFSAPHSLPVLGAAIASARIFLSDELSAMQSALNERVKYCQKLLDEYNLPVVSNPLSPIFFVGFGLLRVSYNMMRRLMNEGLYVNIASFPAVPEGCTGIRFTITLHHSFEDIGQLVSALAHHFRLALEDEERTSEDVNRAFRRVPGFRPVASYVQARAAKADYEVIHYTSIENISKVMWDYLMADKGTSDWNTLRLLEKSFKGNSERENNWDFHYYIITTQGGKPLLATYFTVLIAKDDTLSPPEVSKAVEKERVKDPYYLTSLTITMGTLLTEGEHLFLDRSAEWKNALSLLLDHVGKLQDRYNAAKVYLRDFAAEDVVLRDFFKDQGFITVPLPDSHIIENKCWTHRHEYLSRFSHDKRYYHRRHVLPYESFYDIKITSDPSYEQLMQYYHLYKNVAKKSFEVNGFLLPFRLFRSMAESGLWEFIELSLKPEYDERPDRKPVGVAINYRGADCYSFLLTGMDYTFLERYNLYPQILWQIVQRGNTLGAERILLGLTASQNKRKFNAMPQSRVGFVQMKDFYSMSVLGMVNVREARE